MKTRFSSKFFGLPLFLFIFLFAFQNAFSQNGFGGKNIASPTRPRVYKSAEQQIAPAKFVAAELERRVFDLINRERVKDGLTALEWNNDAARIARIHSGNMANLHFFSHIGLDGKMVNNRADDIGITKWREIGENIAYNRGFKSPIESAVQSWMNSAGHRENILKADWRESGVGVVALENGTYYFTQVFLCKN